MPINTDPLRAARHRDRGARYLMNIGAAINDLLHANDRLIALLREARALKYEDELDDAAFAALKANKDDFITLATIAQEFNALVDKYESVLYRFRG